MIFSNPAIANPAGAGAGCFLSCGPTQTAMKHKSKH